MSAKRIGYLRAALALDHEPSETAAPATKAMWRKLVAEGYMAETAKDVFSLTPSGELAIEAFDRALSEDCRAVLNAVKAEQSGAGAMKGMLVCVHSGLVDFVGGTTEYRLTEAGKRIADPIGANGYFTKSGNKVLVRGAYLDGSGKAMLDVERVDGESKGKGMSIPRGSFVLDSDWSKYLEGGPLLEYDPSKRLEGAPSTDLAQRRLTPADLAEAGIKVGELAVVLGVHRTTVSDLLSAKTGRATPGAHAVLALWPHVSERTRKDLVLGKHFSGTVEPELAITKSNTDFQDWWRLLHEECRKRRIPEPGFQDASDTYDMRKTPAEAAALIAR